MTDPPTLQIRHLSKLFSTKSGPLLVLDDISMSVKAGEFACLVGASGCGKSTLLNIVAGLEDPSAGEVLLSGSPVAGPGADRGMVFQNYTLYPWLSVRGNVEFGLKLRKQSAPERRERVDHYLEIVGLAKFADSLPRALSGGMKQRAAIARAMVNEPQILLLDEPFGALDCQTKETLQEFLLSVVRRTGITVLMITHDVEEAVFLADRVYAMSARPGRIAREVHVSLGRDRCLACKRTAAFQQIEQDILDLLRARVPLAEETR
ncbi:ABC transporter ATP-binding protein [Gloeobacter violaceus]|uniref:ABC transporter ATP-binding protein n=1 Tax=Gloeobacter violaceus (strain ATCC 29082 / PCC 7421) TaxID=251221 RepID=Q7NP83_GLOVI|nr:ABC transporter ATP-binding protein [Gloeobacter violaceus]BAC88115.1 ABC transporter ATP-binding protein [Gloeobacter violaceus PCC 7421]